MLFATARGSDFVLAGSDPSHAESSLTVTVNEPLKPVELDAGMTSSKDEERTTITLALAEGRRLLGRFTRSGADGADHARAPSSRRDS